jgi:ABC-type enterochelin transport system permease subunit
MIEILGYSAIALLTAKYFGPLDSFRGWLTGKLANLMVSKDWEWLYHFIVLVTCPVCQSFWLTLVLTHSLPMAAIASILTKVIDLIIEKLDE